MLSRAGAGTPAEQELIVNYLARFFGRPINVIKASGKELEDDLGLTAAQARAIVKFRAEKGPFPGLPELLKVPGIDGQSIWDMAANIVFQAPKL